MAGGTWAQSCSSRELSITGRYSNVTCDWSKAKVYEKLRILTAEADNSFKNCLNYSVRHRQTHTLRGSSPFQSFDQQRTECASSSADQTASSPDPAGA